MITGIVPPPSLCMWLQSIFSVLPVSYDLPSSLIKSFKVKDHSPSISEGREDNVKLEETLQGDINT